MTTAIWSSFKSWTARRKLLEQQLKLKAMRTSKVRNQESIKTKMFSVLKYIGVELSSYHGGSLNGKDIKRVMNNATHIFDTLLTILKDGARPGCVLKPEHIDTLLL
jgi:hypothetical protein